MPNILEIQDLSIVGKVPGQVEVPIIKGVSFDVAPGEVVALIGESGAGKSTLGLAALGYTRNGCTITSGQIRFRERDISQLKPDDKRMLRGQHIAYIAQSAAASFNPAHRIGQQVTEAPELHGLFSSIEAREKAVDLYRQLALPNPDKIGDRYPHQVSGGQLQRLMTAMAMSCTPDILVLDEPTTALDVTTQIEVLLAIKNIIRKNNTAGIYITHDLAVVSQIADRIVVLLNGEIIEVSDVETILNKPSHPYTQLLMDSVKEPPQPKATASLPSLDKKQEYVLELKDVCATYSKDSSDILTEVNFGVPAGEVIAVVGESGCGKTTVARVAAGLLSPRKGKILFKGEELPKALKDRSKEQLHKLQMIFQLPDVSLNPRHTIEEIIGRPLAFYQRIKGKNKKEKIKELLHLVGLNKELMNRYPTEISGGQKQRVCIARALAAEPEVLLCDEVTSALDTVVGARVLELLKNLKTQLGVSFVFITHDLATVADIADRVAVFYAGRIVEQGPKERVFSPPYHPYTRLLLNSVPRMEQGWLESVIESREALAGLAGSVNLGFTGCPFEKRCPVSIDGVCDQVAPVQSEVVRGHSILCHRKTEDLHDHFLFNDKGQ